MNHLFRSCWFSRIGLLALLAIALQGCGGSGGGDVAAPTAPTPALSPQSIKTFSFSWDDVAGETEYRLLENPDGLSGYTRVATIAADASSHELQVFLPGRVNASYILQACNSGGCSDSTAVFVKENLASAVGYIKASNTEAGDFFGSGLSLAADGNTLAVGARVEDSNAVGNQADNSADSSGAVYVFTRSGSDWSQQAYIKASNTGEGDQFGRSVALAADGNTLVVGADLEDSNATGIGGDEADNSDGDSGAVYVFTRSGNDWSQQAYVKASNTGEGDQFGRSLALAADGNTLAVGSPREDSNATGIGGDEDDNSTSDGGAVYVFTRSGAVWSQQAYVKASNTEAGDRFEAGDEFGFGVALAADGNTLAVGAPEEESNDGGIDGNQADNSAGNSGAVYVFTRGGTVWSQQAYVKASNTEAFDFFGIGVALAADGNTLAVGADEENSNATGVGGNQTNNSAGTSGAVYVFIRSGTNWSQQAYIKASNTEAGDRFGSSVALAADGNTLAVGSPSEDSSAIGIRVNQSDNSAGDSGAVYVFTRSGAFWSQQVYVKASNTEADDSLGQTGVALAADGNTLAVQASSEDSNATGIGGDQADNSASLSGAVYLY